MPSLLPPWRYTLTSALTADVEVVGVCERLGAAPRPHLGRLPDLVRTVLRCYLLNNGHKKRLQIPHSSLHVLHDCTCTCTGTCRCTCKSSTFALTVARFSMTKNTETTYDDTFNDLIITGKSVSEHLHVQQGPFSVPKRPILASDRPSFM